MDGFSGNSKSRETVRTVFLMDSLPDELPDKVGKGTEKRTIESKGAVRSSINKANDLYFYRKGELVPVEEKSAGVQAVSPDMGIRMEVIVMVLILTDLTMIFC